MGYVVKGKDPDGEDINNINELEWVDGLIYFNIWRKNCIGTYNVSDGKVVAWMDLTDIYDQEHEKNSQAEVLNGIAFTRPNSVSSERKMVVTGKRWQWMYELDV